MTRQALSGSAAASRLAVGMGLLPHRKLAAAITSHLNDRGIHFSTHTNIVGTLTYSTSARQAMTPQQAADTFLGHLGGFAGVMDSFASGG